MGKNTNIFCHHYWGINRIISLRKLWCLKKIWSAAIKSLYAWKLGYLIFARGLKYSEQQRRERHRLKNISIIKRLDLFTFSCSVTSQFQLSSESPLECHANVSDFKCRGLSRNVKSFKTHVLRYCSARHFFLQSLVIIKCVFLNLKKVEILSNH